MSQEIKIYKPQIKVYYRANNVEEWLITEETKEPLIRAVMAKN
jgi:hypothetical protein